MLNRSTILPSIKTHKRIVLCSGNFSVFFSFCQKPSSTFRCCVSRCLCISTGWYKLRQTKDNEIAIWFARPAVVTWMFIRRRRSLRFSLSLCFQTKKRAEKKIEERGLRQKRLRVNKGELNCSEATPRQPRCDFQNRIAKRSALLLLLFVRS